MNGLFQDLRYAVRRLRKRPGFTSVAVITLGLGISATTAMFSLVDRILFRSVPYPAGNQLVSVGVTAPIIDGEFLFARSYMMWRERQTAFAGFTSSTGVSDCDLSEENPVRVSCGAVESTFLPTFKIQPVLGRNFSRDEDRPLAPKVALLSYGLWQSRFGGDRGVIGRSISLDGQPTRIVGVLPDDFEFPTLAHVSVLVPEALDESIVQRNLMGPVVRVFGRMRAGSNITQTKAELETLFQDFVQSAPPPFRKVLRLQVRTIQDLQVHDARRTAWLLLASAWAVLLIACANVANLVLSQSVGRRKEFAVRAVVGAGRGRLFRQRLTESMVLALAGGLAGCGLAVVIVRLFVVLSPAGIPHVSDASVDFGSGIRDGTGSGKTFNGNAGDCQHTGGATLGTPPAVDCYAGGHGRRAALRRSAAGAEPAEPANRTAGDEHAECSGGEAFAGPTQVSGCSKATRFP